MLAMNRRAPRGTRLPVSSLKTIASMLAPTGGRPASVGASLLAIDLKSAAGYQASRSWLKTIATMLARQGAGQHPSERACSR